MAGLASTATFMPPGIQIIKTRFGSLTNPMMTESSSIFPVPAVGFRPSGSTRPELAEVRAETSLGFLISMGDRLEILEHCRRFRFEQCFCLFDRRLRGRQSSGGRAGSARGRHSRRTRPPFG